MNYFRSLWLLSLTAMVLALLRVEADPAVPVLTEQQKLTASDAAENNYFGSSIAISGDTMLIGASNKRNRNNGHEDPRGGVYVFTLNEGVWTEQSMMPLIDTGIFSHSPVALSGDVAVASRSVFTRDHGSWRMQSTLNSGGVQSSINPDGLGSPLLDRLLYLAQVTPSC